VVASVLVLLGPAAQTDELPFGSVRYGTIVSSGVVRSYRLFVPSSAARARALPVVFVLHGGLLGNPIQMANSTGFDDRAEAEGFLAVYPWGIANTWNAGTCCGPARDQNVDDVGFVSDLIVDLSSRYRVDRTRVFVTGISNGGMLAYRIGCELSDRVAAIAPVAATMTVHCRAKHPVSVLHIHGLEDEYVPYDGGVGTKGFSKDYRPPVAKAIARWRDIDDCGEPSIRTSGKVRTSISEPCARDTAVVLITIANAGHTWPGSSDTTGLGALLVDPPNDEIGASDVIAAFFRGHPKR
jgi:polyhydroxybutyrate depolymerase